MKVILRRDVDSLGRTGEVVSVATGYARNFLLPKDLAYTVTTDNLRRIGLEKKKVLEHERHRVEESKGFAKRLRAVSCTIEAKASEEGHLYGSVTAPMICDALAREGISLDAKAIQLDKPIKETGVFTVPVHLHAGVETELKVWVMEPQDPEEPGKEG